MLRLTSPGTYQAITYMLMHGKFSNSELTKATKLTKGRISQITSWMTDLGYLDQVGRRYELQRPLEVAKLFALSRSFEKLRVFTHYVKIPDIENYLQELAWKGAIFCGPSAMTFYDLFCEHRGLWMYCSKEKLDEVKEELRKTPTGDFPVNVYVPDFLFDEEINYVRHLKMTGEIRTIIDLICARKLHEATPLISKVWNS